MKKLAAILSGKAAGIFSRIAGKGGSNFPGIVSRKIDKHILKKLSGQIPYTILVTGTNGKTTTSNLLACILKADGKKVLNNFEGANLDTGITACYVKNATLNGKLPFDYAVIEVDEATVPHVAKDLDPNFIVVNNFFRDQLDRYGEIDILLDRVGKGIKDTNASLIVNGDDPFSVQLSRQIEKKDFFGLSQKAHQFDKHEMSESKFCPECRNELMYSHVHYSQLGYFSCECGFARPPIQYEVSSVQQAENLTFTLNHKDFSIPVSGIHNVYNATAAVACAKKLGIGDESIKKGLMEYRSMNGRMQQFLFKKQPYILNLVKNPAGVNISLSEVTSSTEDKQVIIFLNDMEVDGRDISWIWDADFERLNREDIKRVICSGKRAYDLAVRMKYSGIDINKITVIPSKEKAIDYVLNHPLRTYLFPNYTALEPVRKYLLSKVTGLQWN